MRKPLKTALIVLAAIVVLVAVALAVFAATFNPNDYKPLIIRKVQEAKQRTLSIPGDISLSFFPNLGVKLGPASLSERNNQATFASVESARVSLALLPLLRKQVVVDHVSVDGLKASVRRFKDGRTSIDDLLSPQDQAARPAEPAPEGAPGPADFDIGGISITNAAVAFEDEKENRSLALTNASIETGRIAPGKRDDLKLSAHVKARNPDVDAQVSVKGEYLLEPQARHYAFKGLSAEVVGMLAGFTDLRGKLKGDVDYMAAPLRLDVAGLSLSVQGKQAQGNVDVTVDVPSLSMNEKTVAVKKIDGKAHLVQGGRTATALLSVPPFEGSAQGFTVPRISLSLDGKQGDVAIKGSLAAALKGDLKSQVFELTSLAGDFALPNPRGGSLALKLAGGATANLAKKNANAALSGKLDQSSFNAKLGLPSFSPLAYAFDVSVDQLDVDRYRAAAAAKPKEGASKNAGAGADTPIDVSALRNLNATGSLRVGALQVAGVKASNVRLDLRAAGGKADISPLAANLYGGSLSGGVSVVASSMPRFIVRQTLSNVSVGPLLKDATGNDRVEGRGSVVLDIATQGTTVNALKKGLNGKARVDLREGAVRGINVAQAIRTARAKLGGATGEQTGSGSQNDKADFSELSGSFNIANGVARNDDLLAKSPLLRVAGSGNIDLGEGRLDYLVKATVVDTLQGQGGPELQALRGRTIPVRLSGPFEAIDYKVDFAGLVQETAKEKIKEKVQERLGDKLRGLFGK